MESTRCIHYQPVTIDTFWTFGNWEPVPVPNQGSINQGKVFGLESSPYMISPASIFPDFEAFARYLLECQPGIQNHLNLEESLSIGSPSSTF